MSENKRPTIELTTPNDNKVVVFEYINGGELRKFQTLFIDEINASDLLPTDKATKKEKEEASKKAMANVKASTMLTAQELLLSLLVISVDGKAGDGKELVFSLRPADTEFVIAELTAYTTEGEGKKK